MAEKNKKDRSKLPSELRYDLVSKDWVVVATGRAKRPHAFKKQKRQKIKMSKKDCPFCNIETQEEPLLIYSGKGKDRYRRSAEDRPKKEAKIPDDWSTVVIPNKYPALKPYTKLDKEKEGKYYQRMNAVGFCELVIFRDHKKHFPQLTIDEVEEIFDAYKQRYLDLMGKKFVNYISIFHNHGPEAGASQPHPHSQIITTPLIDIDLNKALSNSKQYFQKNKKCIYCEMNKWERKKKTRIIFENKYFSALCPFASKMAFEVIVSPTEHLAYFERIDDEKKKYLAEAFQMSMKALYEGLGDPAYNFYLHTAPCDGKDHSYYHWHWTILPKTSTFAGFEIGTRMEISTIEPEKAAAYLREQIS
ncbi:MAG: galactose-1-phosphate uridylyltransferase [Candidatus Nealsonbacteria bacterium]|nr:galactose-1-phosphate uridylyltransferase [Candidatus Nealsonbacteria bacterium]